jgi:hypothetical protein
MADPDPLAGAVLRSLGRSFRNHYSLSPVRAAIIGGLSFGLVPIWRLMRQFDDYVTFERQQLTYAGEWIQSRGGPDATAFRDRARMLRFRPAIKVAALLCVWGAFMPMVMDLLGAFTFDGLLQRTYGFGEFAQHGIGGAVAAEFAAWNIGLGLAYGLHWLQIRLHERDLAQLVGVYNRLARREGADAIAVPRARTGIDGWWIVVAVILVLIGGWWAIPLVLAGAAQRRYINRTSTALRADLAGGIRAMLEQRRPAVALSNYMIHAARCDRPVCRAMLPAGARFCPRCGKTAQPVKAA